MIMGLVRCQWILKNDCIHFFKGIFHRRRICVINSLHNCHPRSWSYQSLKYQRLSMLLRSPEIEKKIHVIENYCTQSNHMDKVKNIVSDDRTNVNNSENNEKIDSRLSGNTNVIDFDCKERTDFRGASCKNAQAEVNITYSSDCDNDENPGSLATSRVNVTYNSDGVSNLNYYANFYEDHDRIFDKDLATLEIDLLKHEGKDVPNPASLSPGQWNELLKKSDKLSRLNYLRYVRINQIRKEEKMREIMERKLEEEIKEAQRHERSNPYIGDDGHIRYAEDGNTIFLEMSKREMVPFWHGRLFNSMMYGQHFVFDMDFDSYMSLGDRNKCVTQIVNAYSTNRHKDDPFYFHFCNADKESEIMKQLENTMPYLYKPEFPATVHRESYLDCFPVEKLIYITRYSTEDMEEFDHDAVYVIGGLVTLKLNSCAYDKARREGIRTLRLPIDRYLSWGTGKKTLTFNCVLKILLDMRETGDWNYAFRHIPKSKLKNFEDSQARLQHDLKRIAKPQVHSIGIRKKVYKERVKGLYDE
ncbi:tRNA methyltransferase 10 C [Halocaridina rubra]|uniref:RNA (guanine-9-)-methyltransferase domain-containing protein 1 n=1 Tax=Halocaridina rubra TaxID=373956 RepID=A0AAN8XBS6_HALRR